MVAKTPLTYTGLEDRKKFTKCKSLLAVRPKSTRIQGGFRHATRTYIRICTTTPLSVTALDIGMPNRSCETVGDQSKVITKASLCLGSRIVAEIRIIFLEKVFVQS